jgi:hypothetical protein
MPLFDLFLLSYASLMANTKSFDGEMSIDEGSSDTTSLFKGGGLQQRSLVFESYLPGNNFNQVMQGLLYFESQIESRFVTLDAVYRYTCGRVECSFNCGVPHLEVVVRVRGLLDDQIGIILQAGGRPVENILPQGGGGTIIGRGEI